MTSRSARRRRPTISYKEDDFEEAVNDDNFQMSSESDGLAIPESSSASRKRKRPNRESHTPQTRQRSRISYREDDSPEEQEELEEEEALASHSRKIKTGQISPSRKARPHKRNESRQPTRAKPERNRSAPTRKLRHIGAPRKPAIKETVAPIKLVSDHKVPAWITLPYDIVRSIFSFAAYPLMDRRGLRSPNTAWLVRSTRICRAFKEPVLQALLDDPPLDTAGSALQLLDTLVNMQDAPALNYGTKIKRLNLELNVLAHGELVPILPLTPMVRDINIWDGNDDQSTMLLNRGRPRWNYDTDETLATIGQSSLRLRGWHWHEGLFASHDIPTKLDRMILMHTQHAFSYIRSLVLSGFAGDCFHLNPNLRMSALGIHGWEAAENADTYTTDTGVIDDAKLPAFSPGITFAQALNKLTRLEEIQLRNSSMEKLDWLLFLDKPLKVLHLKGCTEIESSTLQKYLEKAGRQIKELQFENCSSLNLSFLTQLAQSCPKLEKLKMDLTFQSRLLSTELNEPKFENLLSTEEIPSWPSTLQDLELLHLRRWTASASEGFFKSLIDSSKELTDLRRLVISASIDTNWRDRATFRDTWIARLERVFLRKSAPPDPNLQSLKAFRLWKQRDTESRKQDTGKLRREFSHVAITPKRQQRAGKGEETGDDSSSEESDSGKYRSKGKKKAIKSTRNLRSHDKPQDDDKAPSLKDKVLRTLENHVQGLCDTVDIRIDNLRPREQQMRENDFLDEEISGDEDWVEGNDESDDDGGGRYAW